MSDLVRNPEDWFSHNEAHNFQMESKFQTEMEEHKQKLDKEYEGTRQNFMLEIERLKKKMVQELEKKVQNVFIHRTGLKTQSLKVIKPFSCSTPL